MKIISKTIIILILLSSVVFADQDTTKKADNNKNYREIARQIKLLGEVIRGVNLRYVDSIETDDFIRAGIDGMLATLDPYTVFLDKKGNLALDEMIKGEYCGVGIEIGLRGKSKKLTIIAPIEDTPAFRVGVKSGDVIVAVDGKSTKGFTTSDAAKHIRGKEDSEVTLSIRRKGYSKPLDYIIARKNIRIHDVAYAEMLDGEIGYIKLVAFSSKAGRELRKNLRELLKKEPIGMILDLRSNPGGLLTSAVDVAQEFLQPKELIVSQKGRNPRSIRNYPGTRKPLASDIPLVVLVNRGSASASEIVAGSIQDHDRGVVIGTTTFGKGLVQSKLKLSEGNALKVTSARYYTPSGRCIQRDRSKSDDFIYEDDLTADDLSASEPDTSASDTSRSIYYTDAGREVYGGGGITPDIIIEPSLLDPVSVEMIRKGVFFNFIDEWLSHNERPDTVKVTTEILTEFNSYLDSVDFTPPIRGEKQLESLRKIGRNDTLDDLYFANIDSIEAALKRESKTIGQELEKFIYQRIDRELASALGGREWRIRSSFDEDIQLTTAIELLKDEDRYRAELRKDDQTDIEVSVE